MRKIRYSVKALVNVGNYENIAFELEESIETDDAHADRDRSRLIECVESSVEQRVLNARRDLERARIRREADGDIEVTVRPARGRR